MSSLTTAAAVHRHQIAPRLFISIAPVLATRWQLHPEEEVLVADATVRRRAQFAAGRVAARHAMSSMPAAYESRAPILQGDEGEPLFPLEVRGSISHTKQYAVALVGCADVYESVGVDIDDARPLGDIAAAGVTWDAEVARIHAALNLGSVAEAQNFAFSAKEAVFKCQYLLTFDAALKQKQARLVSIGEQGVMGVVGWRARVGTAKVLERILIQRLKLAGQTVAVATVQRCGLSC